MINYHTKTIIKLPLNSILQYYYIVKMLRGIPVFLLKKKAEKFPLNFFMKVFFFDPEVDKSG